MSICTYIHIHVHTCISSMCLCVWQVYDTFPHARECRKHTSNTHYVHANTYIQTHTHTCYIQHMHTTYIHTCSHTPMQRTEDIHTSRTNHIHTNRHPCLRYGLVSSYQKNVFLVLQAVQYVCRLCNTYAYCALCT
jgi:hypothetical protein